MLFITFSNLWSFFYFTYFTYILFAAISGLYIISFTLHNLNAVSWKNSSIFNLNRGYDFFYVYACVPTLLSIFTNLWVGPIFTSWFGHVLVSGFAFKFIHILSLFSLITVLILSLNSLVTSRTYCDFLMTTMFLYYWLVFLFFANSFFSLIFIIEALSSLIFLFLVTSSFSSTTYYNNLNFFSSNFYQNLLPNSFLKSLIFYFWISLITSLFLFIFLTLFYLNSLTSDLLTHEIISKFLINSSNSSTLFSLTSTWFFLILSIFIKCGIAPFFLWKPTFFNGLPLHALLFYVTFFYFFMYIYFIYLLSSYCIDFIYFYSHVLLLFAVLGLLILLSLITESLYLKTFLAISSMLNSLFTLIVLVVNHTSDYNFWV